MIIHDKDCFLLDLDGTLLDLKFDHKFWFEYVVQTDPWEEDASSGGKANTDGVNNMNTLPFANIPYKNINFL